MVWLVWPWQEQLGLSHMTKVILCSITHSVYAIILQLPQLQRQLEVISVEQHSIIKINSLIIQSSVLNDKR